MYKKLEQLSLEREFPQTEGNEKTGDNVIGEAPRGAEINVHLHINGGGLQLSLPTGNFSVHFQGEFP